MAAADDSFVVASDPHIGLPATPPVDLANWFEEIGKPAFVVITGDITTGAAPEQYAGVKAALDGLADGVPWVPVAGNHDWYDNGVGWKQAFGRDNDAFDALGMHFIVWNMAMTEPEILDYVRESVKGVTAPIVMLTHAPPSPRVVEELARLHVPYLITGHAHSNRVVHHEGGVTEWNTEPLLMGGLDFTPAGYRVFHVDHGRLWSEHRVIVDRPITHVMEPPCANEIVVGASTPPAVNVDGKPVGLHLVGGWDWRVVDPLVPGPHVVTIAGSSSTVNLCRPPPPPTQPLSPELAMRWSTPVGGHLLSARPAIADGVVYVTATDLADGGGGGVIALDLATGAIKWRFGTPEQVRGGVAVVDGVVVIPEIDGTIVGVDAATGRMQWTHELARVPAEARATFASVTASDGEAIIGHQRDLAVLDVRDGHARWHLDPVPAGENSQSLAAAAVGDGFVVGTFNRLFGGVQAWDLASGSQMWQVESADTIGINATPVIADHTVFIANAADQVTALELGTGRVLWRAPLDDAGFEWGNATIGTPAYAHGILIVPTLYNDVVALDARTGAELWRHAALPGPLRTTHYRGAGEAGYESSPVIVDDTVWIADASGELAALDLRTGSPKARLDVGAPVLSGLATSGPWLVVASFDGTVHGYATTPAVPIAAPSHGCASSDPSGVLSSLVALLAMRRWNTGARRRSRARTSVAAPPTSL
ncbi:MAG: PQQ-binding-like beta-propeller repeat protein [Kofleriaceae bacterium]